MPPSAAEVKRIFTFALPYVFMEWRLITGTALPLVYKGGNLTK
jgi:hypothetical protein